VSGGRGLIHNLTYGYRGVIGLSPIGGGLASHSISIAPPPKKKLMNLLLIFKSITRVSSIDPELQPSQISNTIYAYVHHFKASDI